MGSAGSVLDGATMAPVAPPTSSYATHIPSTMTDNAPAAQARVILSIQRHDATIHCTRADISPAHHAISHRWQDRNETQTFTVHCDNEPPYVCELLDAEVGNLEALLSRLGQGLWLDYVCIDQSSSDDKVAQVNIMGNIYANATSVVLGPYLRLEMPPRDYLERAWCFQERMFGPIKFLWDMSSTDLSYLIAFANDVAMRVPGLQEAFSFINRNFDWNEHWRIGALHKIGREDYPQTRRLCDRLEELINAPRHEANQREMAETVLRIREAVPCTHAATYSEWNLFIFDCQASIEKDRLFGTWGVPLYQSHLPLSYEYPDATWHLIATTYPDADYAFHAPHSAPGRPHGGFAGFATTTQLVCHIMQHTLLTPGTHAQQPVGAEKLRFTDSNEVATLAWDDQYIGVAWPHQTFHFIVSKECLRRGKGLGGEAGPTKKFIHLIERLRALGCKIPSWKVPFDLKARLEQLADTT
ncbi:hypothetical protein SPRG_06859 [Saprolegnia parasitica CBS 223.65]|uniref:Heterokaryon incompatibility domain-containing protein n=1 Tax=Saprolegnia parasitica (strain CBS 223.65) TaxID=695850 RepID=A0A067CM20_SAPPC|nr:hypothetical protein SPRG_06859 [Saprolegnia parasitica CBS 223.65]KDO27591.1 hypothetical protein SPRG_06859 [Saprolegnia parasitica CBS 223.65]|eukprot:XP_012201716.1 hypothetical protein SPRG_06859 [Saprolegnia parasitica CBS 223.65]